MALAPVPLEVGIIERPHACHAALLHDPRRRSVRCLAFRDEFEYADAASPAMAAFSALRAEHEPLAKKAMGEARQAFRQGRRDEGYAKSREVADRYYASTFYRLAKKWLAEQK